MGCRKVRAQDELLRVVLRADDGTLEIGRTLPGRGAWLCADTSSCVELAITRRALDRALRTIVTDTTAEALRGAWKACARLEGRSMTAGHPHPGSDEEGT